jgi:hypothetical protein
MKAASIAELKKTLVRQETGDLLEICLRLARFKKENKELLTYLLYLSENEQAYVKSVCTEIEGYFDETPNMRKKTLRKHIRWMDKCLRFSGNKETEIQVRVHFCRQLLESKTPIRKQKVMWNMFDRQRIKINKAIETLHPDVQLDYRGSLLDLEQY